MRKYFKGRINSFAYAFKGLASMLKEEPNAVIHSVATIGVISAGIYYKIQTSEWLFIAAAITLVWAAEAINTSLEALVDLASPDYHKHAEKAKDTAAAAVLIVSFFAITVAAIIFIPKIFNF